MNGTLKLDSLIWIVECLKLERNTVTPKSHAWWREVIIIYIYIALGGCKVETCALLV
jgi:hypothetical protein